MAQREVDRGTCFLYDVTDVHALGGASVQLMTDKEAIGMTIAKSFALRRIGEAARQRH